MEAANVHLSLIAVINRFSLLLHGGLTVTFHFALGLGTHAELLGPARRRHHRLPLGPPTVWQAAASSSLSCHTAFRGPFWGFRDV